MSRTIWLSHRFKFKYLGDLDDIIHEMHKSFAIFVVARTHLKYIVSFWIQYHDALIEMMVFHRAGRVQNGQRAGRFRLKRIIGAAMVQIVTQTRH